MNVAHLDLKHKFYAARDYVNYREPIGLNKCVDYSWLDYALQQLGPYQP